MSSEAVRLAVRCQHIRRWTVPRDSYPEGRDGYRRWRTDLGRFHAATAGGILREVGYDEESVGRVQALLRKERLKADPEVQLLEDVVCPGLPEPLSGPFRGAARGGEGRRDPAQSRGERCPSGAGRPRAISIWRRSFARW